MVFPGDFFVGGANMEKKGSLKGGKEMRHNCAPATKRSKGPPTVFSPLFKKGDPRGEGGKKTGGTQPNSGDEGQNTKQRGGSPVERKKPERKTYITTRVYTPAKKTKGDGADRNLLTKTQTPHNGGGTKQTRVDDHSEAGAR